MWRTLGRRFCGCLATAGINIIRNGGRVILNLAVSLPAFAEHDLFANIRVLLNASIAVHQLLLHSLRSLRLHAARFSLLTARLARSGSRLNTPTGRLICRSDIAIAPRAGMAVMDTSYLEQQVSTIIGKLHELFDEIGVPSHERDTRESEVNAPAAEHCQTQN